MKLQIPPECSKKSAGEVSDNEVVIATLFYTFGTGVRTLQVHFLSGVEAEQIGVHICCLEEKTLMVEQSF